MKIKLSLFLAALLMCLTSTNAKSPFEELKKIKGVQCQQFDAIPEGGTKMKNISIGNGDNNELVQTFDPKDIIILLTEKQKSIDKLFSKANDICKRNAFESLINVNDGDDRVRIYAQFGDTRSTIAIVVADDEDGVVLSGNIKGNRETIMELLKGKVTFTH
ncbi:MAG: DUF4252 domain-containing protein [Bacteroidaceae bacterium]|nr:DUF4252 domain-containing protein [Bacteroidaceae bacterium]